jgi:hypothetical protein
MELQEQLSVFRFLDIKSFTPSSPIASTAVIELESEAKRSWYFLLPKGGGLSISWEGRLIQVITPQAPLGAALLGKRVGDEIEVEIQRMIKDYLIVAVE